MADVRRAPAEFVTELGKGSSVTNSAEPIWRQLVDEYGEPLVLFEHWRTGDGEDHARFDQVTVVDGRPHWRRMWPTPSTNPLHDVFDRWVAVNGLDLVAQLHDGEPA